MLLQIAKVLEVNVNDLDHEHTDSPLNKFADKYYQKFSSQENIN